MSTEIIEGFRLSPQQEHLWLLQKDGDSAAYRAQCAVSMEGLLDKATLRQALEDVMQRHEILHTTFRYLPEMTLPLQVIGESKIEWSEEDPSQLEDEEKAARTDEIFRQLGKQPFHYGQETLLQVLLLKLNAKNHLLVLSMPSLYMDSAGLKNLLAEMTGCAPLLLLDEVIAHLDPGRRAALFDALAALAAQVWMTGADPAPFADVASRAQLFAVSPGRVSLTPGARDA